MFNIILHLISVFIFEKQRTTVASPVCASIPIIKKIKRGRTCPVWDGQGGAGGGRRGALPFTFSQDLALSDYFQDGGGRAPGCQLCLALPLEHPAADGQGWKRRVPVEHFPPEVSWCPTGVYQEGGAPATWFWGLCSQGSWPTAGHKWNHCLLRGSEAGPQWEDSGKWGSRS